jgi:hypothetical protein
MKRLFTLLAVCYTLVSCLAYFLPWRWRRYVPPKCQLTFSGLQGVISQEIVHNHHCDSLRSNILQCVCFRPLFLYLLFCDDRELWSLCYILQIYFGDPLPKMICHKCLYKLDVMYDFRLKCLEANTTLKAQLLTLMHIPEVKQYLDSLESASSVRKVGEIQYCHSEDDAHCFL